MKPLLSRKGPDYQEKVLSRWSKLIDASGNCDTESKKITTALVLESTYSDMCDHGLITESFTSSSDALGAGDSTADGGGAMGSAYIYPSGAETDARIPNIVIPTLTRVFPDLIAHNIVGIQPMDGPVGIAFALRRKYGKNRAAVADSTTNQGNEIGYDSIDAAFTGATGLTDVDNSGDYSSTSDAGSITTGAGTFWNLFSSNTGGYGMSTETGEWLRINEDWPTAEFSLEKGAIEARTRKLAATFSLELQEDLMKMHGIDIDSESVRMMQWDIKAEIDRQLLGEIIKATISANGSGNTDSTHCTTWDATYADGRNQIERIGTLYTHILLRSQQIAINTRRGSANWCVASPTVCGLMERLRDYTGFNSANTGGSGVSTNVAGGVASVGTLREGSISLYRDTFAAGDYVLLGYKGATEWDTGIVYCPYIPVQVARAAGDGNDFNPRIGLRTRYGIMNNLYGAGDYSQMIKIDNLSTDLNGDTAGSQVFIQ